MGMKTAEPQAIKVSDLVSASGSAISFSSGSSSPSGAGIASGSPSATSGMKPAAMSTAASTIKDSKTVKPDLAKLVAPASSGAMVSGGGFGGNEKKKFMDLKTIIGIVIIVLLAGATGYLFYQNMTLSSQAGSLSQASSGTAAQLSTLNATVAALNASNTALAAQVATLGANNDVLQANLSLLVVPQGADMAPQTVSVTGALSGSSKIAYILSTQYGVNVTVKNSKDAKVAAVLTPLVGNKSVELTGTHTPGSQALTVTAVNGASLDATSTATSTPAAAGAASSTATSTASSSAQ